MGKTISLIEEPGFFSLFEYCDSHNQILFRSHNIKSKENSDILFSNVKYLDIPLSFSNCKIYIGNEDDRSSVQQKFHLNHNQKVIVIEDDCYKYYVVAMQVLFQKNTFPPDETSMPIKREKPLTSDEILAICDEIDQLNSEKGVDYVIENVIQNTGNWKILV